MSALQANLAILVAVLLAGISALLCIVGVMTWRRIGAGKLAWVAVAFGLFAAQGVYLARDAYMRRAALAEGWDALPYLSLTNLAIVLALYVAVLKR